MHHNTPRPPHHPSPNQTGYPHPANAPMGRAPIPSYALRQEISPYRQPAQPPYGALRSIAGDIAMGILPTPALEAVMAQEISTGRATVQYGTSTQPTVDQGFGTGPVAWPAPGFEQQLARRVRNTPNNSSADEEHRPHQQSNYYNRKRHAANAKKGNAGTVDVPDCVWPVAINTALGAAIGSAVPTLGTAGGAAARFLSATPLCFDSDD